jgi:prepilin-type N-terminal cleavage/methylation domain-containing protein
MTQKTMDGNNRYLGARQARHLRLRAEEGFTLVELMIALLIMTGAFVALAGALPLAAIVHRAALEREQALSLAQYQLEYFLTNPGPYPGDSGSTSDFANASDFPQGFTGSYAAYAANGAPGLTSIVVTVTPPHAPKVELSAIDTTYANIVF